MVPFAHGVAVVLRGNVSALLGLVETGTVKHGILILHPWVQSFGSMVIAAVLCSLGGLDILLIFWFETVFHFNTKVDLILNWPFESWEENSMF